MSVYANNASQRNTQRNTPRNTPRNTQSNTPRNTQSNTPGNTQSNASIGMNTTPPRNNASSSGNANNASPRNTLRNAPTGMNNSSQRNVNSSPGTVDRTNISNTNRLLSHLNKRQKMINPQMNPINNTPTTNIQKFFKPYNERVYSKFVVQAGGTVNNFVMSIKNALHSANMESVANILDIENFKQIHNLKEEITKRHVYEISAYYRICINIWDFNDSLWYQYGDITICNVSVLLFKEKDDYGYLILNEQSTSNRSKASTTAPRSKASTTMPRRSGRIIEKSKEKSKTTVRTNQKSRNKKEKLKFL